MKYTVIIGGHNWAAGPALKAASLSEARKAAEAFGATADWAVVCDRTGRERARFIRDTGGNGRRWFRASL